MNNPFHGAVAPHFSLLDIEGKPLLLLRQAMLALKPAFEHYLGMSQARFIVVLLLQTEGEISQTEIQKKLGVDRSMITRLVKQMEADGLVVRRINPADNRFTLVRLSEAGITLHNEMFNRIQELENLLLRGINEDEFQCFQRSLEFIRKNAVDITADAKVQTSLLAENLFD
jgi:DNA-binding MarR family transcriptional regulator